MQFRIESLSQIVVFYTLTIIWATMEGEKEKTVCTEKKKVCQYFNREAGELKHLEGVTVDTI